MIFKRWVWGETPKAALQPGQFGSNPSVREEFEKVFGEGDGDIGKRSGIKRLPARFAVYVPSMLKDLTPIPVHRRDALVEISREFLHDKLGGLTCYEAKGSWRHEGALHEESVFVMESYCEVKKLQDAAYALRQFANALAIEFQQEQLACAVDGEMLWFNPTAKYRNDHKLSVLMPSKRKLASVSWKHVLAPLKALRIESVYGPIA